MARPTDYGPHIVEQTRAYLAEIQNDERVVPKLPTIEGLSLFLNVSRDTLYEWEKVHPEFSDIMEVVRATQAEALMQNGLRNLYQSTITKVLLTKHGYREGVDQTTNGKDLPTPITHVQRDDGNAENQSA